MRISSTDIAISKKVCVQKSPLLKEFTKVSFFFLKSVLEPYGACSMRLQKKKTTPCVSHALCSFARVTRLRDKRGWSVSQCGGCRWAPVKEVWVGGFTHSCGTFGFVEQTT